MTAHNPPASANPLPLGPWPKGGGPGSEETWPVRTFLPLTYLTLVEFVLAPRRRKRDLLPYLEITSTLC